jgi:seryl-tRNA synthetase
VIADVTTHLPGLAWLPDGQSSLSGALLAARRSLDRLFARWGQNLGAAEHALPPCLAREAMAKCGYLESFPHLATLATPLAGGASALLSPAACYHFYVQLRDSHFDAPALRTACATCFRREERYEPLRRQWAFSMREIVCIGTADEVREFLAAMRARVSEWCTAIDLPIDWRHATDPFFSTERNPRYLAQRLTPLKHEAVFDGTLALGSANFHQDFFGETFGIGRAGAPAYSACIAFGLERWLYAFAARFGSTIERWPLDGAAQWS